jgi:hypothetical protein
VEPNHVVRPSHRTATDTPLIAVVLYLAVLSGLFAAVGIAISDIIGRQRALAETRDLQDRGVWRRIVSGGQASRHGVPGDRQ